MKEIINNKINSNSLFLSTWALSETPLDLRAELTQSLTCFSHYLISYQHDYFEINNSDYFSELRKIIDSKNSENGINIIWKNFIIPHMKHNSYLFGKIS